MTYPVRFAEHIGVDDVVVLDNIECIVIDVVRGRDLVQLDVFPTNGTKLDPVVIPRKAKVPLVHLYDEY
jgi:hypothetical protein